MSANCCQTVRSPPRPVRDARGPGPQIALAVQRPHRLDDRRRVRRDLAARPSAASPRPAAPGFGRSSLASSVRGSRQGGRALEGSGPSAAACADTVTRRTWRGKAMHPGD